MCSNNVQVIGSGTGSTTAFQVQNTAGTAVVGVDTTNNKLTVNGSQTISAATDGKVFQVQNSLDGNVLSVNSATVNFWPATPARKSVARLALLGCHMVVPPLPVTP